MGRLLYRMLCRGYDRVSVRTRTGRCAWLGLGDGRLVPGFGLGWGSAVSKAGLGGGSGVRVWLTVPRCGLCARVEWLLGGSSAVPKRRRFILSC
ncbi:MAG: hypothetical protein ACTTJZ_04920 [Sphaerochaetaceae bacterium]